jgi:integration host factor subunit beta
MNKLELIGKLKESHNITKDQATTIVNQFFDEMAAALARGERVEVRGLCTFCVKQYKPYTGRNPNSGEQVAVAPKKLPYFKCGQELKERVDR